MGRLSYIILFIMILPLVFAVSNVRHSVKQNKINITYQGNPQFLINIRNDNNIGEPGGYIWAKTNRNSFTYNISFAINPSNEFYYSIKDSAWSSSNTFSRQEGGNPDAVCGNNIIETGETCDNSNVGSETCESQGFHSGALACLTNCSNYDTTSCIINPTCNTCIDCDTLFTDCTYQECKQDCSQVTQCYYRGNILLVENCIPLDEACHSISSCEDYSQEECNNNPCNLNISCNWDGSCIEADLPFCGDGNIEGNESCDDHNTDSADGCSIDCHIEVGWICDGEPSICIEYSGNLFYVDVNSGEDSNRGTQNSPWKTIQKAADNLVAGDTVLIAPGIYEEGMITPRNSGVEGSPITYRALDPNNPPMLVGTTRLDLTNWTRYNENVYKTTIGWEPKALYLDDIPLFIAQEPDQQNPDDQMETEYFMKVPYDENNDSTYESHYQLIDSGFLTQKDDFWNGATLLLFDGYTRGVFSREVLDFISNENKIILPYNQWAKAGDLERDRDLYAIRNHLSILDKPGEYYINKGKLELLNWNEAQENLEVNVRVVLALGKITRIRFFLINESSGAEVTVNTNMQESETQTFTLDLTGRPHNLIKVYAGVDAADAYELYVWPYNGHNIEEVKIIKEESAFDLNEYGRSNNYLILDGLEIKHYGGDALSFSGGYGSGTNRNIIVRGCDIHHNMGSGIYCRHKCEGLVVENSKIHNNYLQGVSLTGGRDYLIQYNNIYENLDNGIWVGNGNTEIYYVWDVVIRGNYIHHQGSARVHPDNIQIYRTSNSVVDGNYLLQEEGLQNTWFSRNGPVYFVNNIVVGGPAGINSANESYIYNNIFYNSRLRLDAWQEDPNWWTKHSEIRNNIFINEYLTMPPGELRENVIVDHNFYSVEGYPYRVWEDIGFGEGSIINLNPSDPASLYNYFNDLDNFILKPGSELIDAGYSPVPVDLDYNGNKRIQGLNTDIGPHETT